MRGAQRVVVRVAAAVVRRHRDHESIRVRAELGDAVERRHAHEQRAVGGDLDRRRRADEARRGARAETCSRTQSGAEKRRSRRRRTTFHARRRYGPAEVAKRNVGVRCASPSHAYHQCSGSWLQ